MAAEFADLQEGFLSQFNAVLTEDLPAFNAVLAEDLPASNGLLEENDLPPIALQLEPLRRWRRFRRRNGPSCV